MTISSKIEALLVEEKLDSLLTTSALKKISGLAAEVQSLEGINADKTKDVEKLSKLAEERERLLSDLSGQISVANKRLTDVEEREKNMLRLELSAEHQAQRVEDHKDMVKLIFRNAEIRKTAVETGSKPVSDGSGYPVSHPTSNSVIETETNE